MGRGQGEGRVSCFGSWSVGRTAWSRWLSREPSWLQPKQVDRTEASLRSVLCDHRVSAVPPAHSSHCQRSYAPRPALGCPSLPPPQVAKSNLFPSNAPLKPQRRDGRREGTSESVSLCLGSLMACETRNGVEKVSHCRVPCKKRGSPRAGGGARVGRATWRSIGKSFISAFRTPWFTG